MGNCVDKCWADYTEEFKFDDSGLPLNAIINGNMDDFNYKYAISS